MSAEKPVSAAAPSTVQPTNAALLPDAPPIAAPSAVSNETGVVVFDEFSTWVNRFLSGETVSVPQGEAFAWKRREALLDLIQTDPARALALTVPYRWRRELPASVTRYFEEQVDGRGDLKVAIATEFTRNQTTTYHYVTLGSNTYRAFVYGWRARQVSQSEIPLHGIAIAKKLAVSAEPIRLLSAEEAADREQASGAPADAICGVSGLPANYRGQEVAGDTGGAITHFCGVDHFKLVNEQWKRAKSGGGSAGLSASAAAVATAENDLWTHGPKSVLYMRVNFPDDLTEPISEAGAYSAMDGVNAYYTENSYDLTSLTATVTPLLTLPQTKAWYATGGPDTLLSDARETARLAGYDTANYDRDIVAFTSVPDYDFGGLAYVHAKGVWLQSTGVGVTSHELGHNYGLFHANFWDTSTNGFTVSGVGTNLEYGNIYDVMGSGGSQFNAIHKNILDWLTDSTICNITSNGVYRLYAFDVPMRTDGRFYGARITKDFQRDYWLEFRQKFPFNPWVQNGVFLNWAPWEQSSGGTHLIDTTPGTPFDREDATVVVGRTFSDAAAGLHITPLLRGLSGTNAWLDVQVNQGAFPGNQPPELQLELEVTNAAPGQSVHFHAAASDLDGDMLAYAWSFEDFAFSTNNLPWTSRIWNTPGEHVVRCVVSDMKGGVVSANAIVTVGAAQNYRVSGRVLDLEGNPIEGVLVSNGPTNSSNFFGGYTDSEGKYYIVNATGDLALNAVQFGFNFTNANWSNPIYVGSNVVNLDFVGVPLPVVTIAADTNSVPENGGAAHVFTLTRTGDVSTNLTVTIGVSGSATLSSDYNLNPVLSASSTNEIDFPPGSNTLQIAFSTVNDALIEGAETIVVSLIDSTNYFTGALGEAVVNIADDDQATKPTIIVTAPLPSISENGMDSGQFVFTRTGNLQNDVLVNYSVSGTATMGVDYGTLLGVVMIPAGQSSVTVKFQPIDDKEVEADETVIATITPNAAYTIGGTAVQVKILNDDQLTVTISPTSATAAEPSTAGRFTVKREGDLTAALSVFYNVSGTATSGTDYSPLSGSVTIPAGANSANITLTPLDDTLTEGDESVTVTLTNTINYDVGTPSSATLFIRDNEKATVSISVTDFSASEPGDDTAQFVISRGNVVNGNLTVALGISGTAINGIDYIPIDNSVVIPDGASSVVIEIVPFDDLQLEPMEDVRLMILPSTNYNVAFSSNGRVTISDDDMYSVPAAGFCFSSSSVVESESPGIAVALSMTSSVPITVDYKIIGGTAPASRYTLPPGPLTIPATNWVAFIPLQIHDDNVVEAAQTIRIALFNPINATLDGIKIHTYTILDDDLSSVSVMATAPVATETGPLPGNFRISRSGATNTDLQVNFQVTGTASAPTDYAALGTSVNLPAGVAFVDLPVIPINDGTVELNQTVVMTLISAPGAKIASPNVASVTITDNDTNGLPLVTITSTNRPFAVEGGGNGEFVFTRSGSTVSALTVDYTVSGTAVSGDDYVALSDSVTIPAGQSSAIVPVTPIDDALIEGGETVVASLTVGTTYLASFPSAATVIIQDNDQRVWMDASDFNAAEPGTDTGEFTFSRFGTTNTDVQIFYTISGTAANGIDYVTISNSFTIPAGSLTAGLPIVPLADCLVEGPETVTLTLSTGPGYSLDQPTSGTVTIMDDEPMLTLTASVTNIVEGSKPPAILRITRTGDPGYDFTAHLAVGGSATYGVDYPPFLTNVYFSCGIMAIDLQLAPTNELVIEGTETVTAELLPDPAYTILSPSNAIVDVLDAETNQTPLVVITSPTTNLVFLPGTNVNMILEATVQDDSDTNTPPILTWSKVSGPESYVFSVTNEANTTVNLTNVGVYVLRLTADDGVLQGYAEVTAVVGPVETLSTNLLHWTFDEGAGTNVLDGSGNGRNGVLSGSPTWNANGVLGGALSFNGANDYVYQTAGSNVLNGLKAFSISLWIQTALTNSDQGILCGNEAGANPTLALYTRNYASCGSSSNVIEAVIPTTRGSVRYISSSNVSTDGWQQLTLVWSNGLAPLLYINGQLDRPMSQGVALAGALTNCPQFIVGKDPIDSPNSWNGLIDDVRVFPRALQPEEAAALAADNLAPVVDAGTNTIVQINVPFDLEGVVTDDGKPIPPGMVSNTWLVVTNPAPVTLSDPNSLTNEVQLSLPGDYVFRLIGDDGQVKIFDDITVTAIEPTMVYIFASDPDASELSQFGQLGPDPGEFMIYRDTDTNQLTVYLAMSGTASNGVDFISVTNVVTFLEGTNYLMLPVVPFLDHRIEGDETLTFTIVSNQTYSIGSGEATVIIHDSPYGVWSVQRFTLEELTDPKLSSEEADFDHDRLINFVEYAMNRDPKMVETNSPVTVAIELDPEDGQNHVTITYPRRLAPTDAAYAVYVANQLPNWNTGPDYVKEIQVTDDGNGLTETVKAEMVVPYTISTNHFINLRVWLQTTGP